MEKRYERSVTDTYLVLSAGERLGYARAMLLENQLRGFLPVQSRKTEAGQEYYYRISASVSLEEYLQEQPLTLSVWKQLLFSVCRAVYVLEEYLLEAGHLWLEPELIYLQSGREGTTFFFCAYPDGKKDLKEQLLELTQYVLGLKEAQQPACSALCYELYGLLQKQNFCIGELLTLLETFTPPQTEEAVPQAQRKRLFPFGRKRVIL